MLHCSLLLLCGWCIGNASWLRMTAGLAGVGSCGKGLWGWAHLLCCRVEVVGVLWQGGGLFSGGGAGWLHAGQTQATVGVQVLLVGWCASRCLCVVSVQLQNHETRAWGLVLDSVVQCCSLLPPAFCLLPPAFCFLPVPLLVTDCTAGERNCTAGGPWFCVLPPEGSVQCFRGSMSQSVAICLCCCLLLHCTAGGPWFCVQPPLAWPEGQEERSAILADFAPAVGDRRQELVFIGVGLREGALRDALDGCLVTVGEMEVGFRGLPDPFEPWPDVSDMMDLGE